MSFGETFDDETLQPEPRKQSIVELKAGDCLGEHRNYRLEKLLGTGGMGQAWLAEECKGGLSIRKVVCKIVSAAIQADENEMEKLLKQFRLTKDLVHQNICPIYGVEMDPEFGMLFIMGYADSGSLQGWIRKQPNYETGLPLDVVYQMLSPIANALDRAHQMGIVHRDVKPQNILLATMNNRLEPWLIDFGISAQMHETLMATHSQYSTSGTPVYMAPEQWSGQKQDARTDQYALGVMAYEMLTGHLPFLGNLQMLPYMVMSMPVPKAPNLSASVNAALQKAMAKQQDKRFSTCSEFIDTLCGKSRRISSPATTSSSSSMAVGAGLQEVHVPNDFATIEEACQNVQDGGKIIIAPGKYVVSHGLEIKRSVTFCSETDKAGDVLLTSNRSPVFRITGGSPCFQSIMIRSKAQQQENSEVECLYIENSTPQILRCLITAPQGQGIVVTGENANPIIKYCVFKDCGHSGLIFRKNSQGQVQKCEFKRNSGPAVTVKDNGNPSVTDCKICDGEHVGVWVCDKGKGQFQNCEISGNAYPNFYIETKGGPTVAHCKICKGQDAGIAVMTGGRGHFQECDIVENEGPGIAVSTEGVPVFINCQIHGGDDCGITIQEKGRGQFQGCSIFQNDQAGIEVQTGGNPLVTSCTIHNGYAAGVYIHTNGQGTFRDNTLYGNKEDWDVVRINLDDSSVTPAGSVTASNNRPEMPSGWFW